MKINSKKFTLAALAAVAILGLAGNAKAALVNGDIISVDFKSSDHGVVPTGAAVIGASGDIWNSIAGTSGASVGALGAVSLNTVTGASSGATLSVSAGYFNGSSYSSSNLDLYQSNVYLDAVGQYGPTGPSTITISGLGAGTTIDLYLYSASGDGSQGGIFNFGTTKTTADTGAIETSYILNQNYVMFSNLVADGSGNITGTWSADPTQRFSTLNGVQIAVVPEPSTMALAGLGLAGLLGLRRRRTE